MQTVENAKREQAIAKRDQQKKLEDAKKLLAKHN